MRLYLSALLVFLFAVATGAQTSPPQHQHVNVNATVIDGAQHPELIPDSTAYRVWLVAMSLPPNPTAKEQSFQKAHLSQLKLNGVDYLELLSILTDFKAQYLSLIGSYNESAKAALLRGAQADLNSFLQQRDDLVSTTRTAIGQRLTQDGAAQVDVHVQREKGHIQIHTTAGGSQ